MSLHEDLKAYLDGELSPQRADEVRAAIDADPNLRREAEQLQALSVEIRSLAGEPEVVGMERALDAIRPKPIPWWGAAWKPALAIGVPLVLGLAFLALFRRDFMLSAREEAAAGAEMAAPSVEAAPGAALSGPAAGAADSALPRSKTADTGSGSRPSPSVGAAPAPMRRAEQEEGDGTVWAWVAVGVGIAGGGLWALLRRRNA